jgi:hypothetical protein
MVVTSTFPQATANEVWPGVWPGVSSAVMPGGWCRSAGTRYSRSLEVIRFAGANRLCVELTYQCSTRRIEPYSLRRTKDGNVVLHAHNLDRNEHRSYRVDRIESASTTSQIFVPRHAVELTPTGLVTVAPSSAGVRAGRQRMTFARTVRAQRNLRSATGPTYIYQYPMCLKQFRRKVMNGALNPHKRPDGWKRSGGIGHLVDTGY